MAADGNHSQGREAQSLFRREAIDALRDRLGAPVQPVGLASWGLTGFLVSLLVIVAIFLGIGHYTRRETVPGTLEPSAGALRISSNRASLISEVYVHEGDAVRRGQPLFSLSADPTISDGRKLGDVLSEATSEQLDALSRQAAARRDLVFRQQQELEVRLAATRDRSRRLQEGLRLQRSRVELAEQTAQSARILFEKQLLAAIQYRQREEALIAAQQVLVTTESDLAQLAFEERQIAAQAKRLLAEAEGSDAALAANRAQLAERQASRSAEAAVVLTAADAGQITGLQAKAGATAAPGAALAILLPRGVRLQAVLWVPSRAMGFVQVGDRVRLMYDSFPYQRFGAAAGNVAQVARAPTAAEDLPVRIETKEALYRVVVNLDRQNMSGYGREWPLAPGMRLTADMILERQSLFAWLFDKVRAAKVRATPV